VAAELDPAAIAGIASCTLSTMILVDAESLASATAEKIPDCSCGELVTDELNDGSTALKPLLKTNGGESCADEEPNIRMAVVENRLGPGASPASCWDVSDGAEKGFPATSGIAAALAGSSEDEEACTPLNASTAADVATDEIGCADGTRKGLNDVDEATIGALKSAVKSGALYANPLKAVVDNDGAV